MEWRKCYLDLVLVPLGLFFLLVYHLWLWYRVSSKPLHTIIGINSIGRRLWVKAMMKDNDKKNILAVQTLRNTMMGSTLMATTSILLCSGLAAVLSSTYSVKRPLYDSVFGAHGDFTVLLKFVSLLVVLVFAFLCHSLSIRFLNQACFLINVTPSHDSHVTVAYVVDLLEKGFALNTVGNRLFYAALPLLLWTFGPLLVVFSSLTMVLIFYNLDVAFQDQKVIEHTCV
ncbi:uncharacterized protein LOC122017037 [Zingiber officinale]|uniref:DUF599 domain-containing protein n=1 Tax=Zingiber officinale TaxID=94328 RepID=A0A8J5FHC5_ZINOF|nr:uncharacterized protein LOC122017037 [Zingiber officinale]KAG6484130.1 hypothetical protein ZIOFF_060924 [Zingiber officinale]